MGFGNCVYRQQTPLRDTEDGLSDVIADDDEPPRAEKSGRRRRCDPSAADRPSTGPHLGRQGVARAFQHHRAGQIKCQVAAVRPVRKLCRVPLSQAAPTAQLWPWSAKPSRLVFTGLGTLNVCQWLA